MFLMLCFWWCFVVAVDPIVSVDHLSVHLSVSDKKPDATVGWTVLNFINILWVHFFVWKFGDKNYKVEMQLEKANQFPFVQKRRA